MTRRLLGAPALLLALTGPAAAQYQIWIRQIGTPQLDGLYALAPDGSGGAYVGGGTQGSLAGPSAGSTDAVLARYDSAGTQVWIRQFGSTGSDSIEALAIDGAGGMFAAGFTSGNMGALPAGSLDVWVGRYDGAGSSLWIRQFGTGELDNVSAVEHDGLGGAYVAGWTEGDLAAPNAGDSDVWLARFDSAGSRLWIRQFGDIDIDEALALAGDGAGGVFITGFTQGGSLGGPNLGIRDAWLARFDGAGDRLWIRQIGTIRTDEGRCLLPDGAGGVFVAGSSDGSVAGPGAGGIDTWLARYDRAGNRLWVAQIGTSADDFPDAMARDGAGGMYVAGTTSGSFGAPSAGTLDVWLARVDGAGNMAWVRQFGTANWDILWAAAPDDSGGVYLAGSTLASLGGPLVGFIDGWVARWSGNCYPDCNGDGALNLADFGCFQSRFALQHPYADCNGDNALNLADFGCFQTRFALGCP